MFKKIFFCLTLIALSNVSYVAASDTKTTEKTPKPYLPNHPRLKSALQNGLHAGTVGLLTTLLMQPAIGNVSPKERLQAIAAGGLATGVLGFLRQGIALLIPNRNTKVDAAVKLVNNYAQAILVGTPAALVALYMVVGPENFSLFRK